MSDPDSGWFLAQLKPNAASIALRNLERQGFEAFLPLAEVTQRRAGQARLVRRPLFPGYLFVRFSTAQGGWRAINATAGLTRLVSFADRPAQVPDAIVDGLRARCDANGVLATADAFQPGDSVTVETGPFAGFIATVETIDADRRVWVLIELMGKPARFSPDHVSPRSD